VPWSSPPWRTDPTTSACSPPARARSPRCAERASDTCRTPAGGFQACWWGWKEVEGGAPLYLQFANDALHFKAYFPESIGRPERRFPLWTSIHEKVIREAHGAKIALKRPGRARSGWTMTVATLEPSPLTQEQDWEKLELVSSVVAEAESIITRVEGSS